MVLEQPPVLSPITDSSGMITTAWNEWLTKLTAALNNTDTKTFVTGVSPTTTDDITYIKGD